MYIYTYILTIYRHAFHRQRAIHKLCGKSWWIRMFRFSTGVWVSTNSRPISSGLQKILYVCVHPVVVDICIFRRHRQPE